MILLSHLPDDMFTLASTITQTVAVANFNLETVASRILAEIDLWATRRPLASRISAIQSEESSANRTTVIWHGPPPQNQWRGQTNSYQRLPQQYQGNQSGYQNQQGSGPASQLRPNNQKGKGPARAKKPSKEQKKSWYEQCKQQQQQANPKGKGKANEVMFVNKVEMYNTSVEEGETPLVFDEDDPLFRFIDYLEGEEGELMDVDEDASSIVTYAGWDANGESSSKVDESLCEYLPREEDNIAGPSQPFWHNSF